MMGSLVAISLRCLAVGRSIWQIIASCLSRKLAMITALQVAERKSQVGWPRARARSRKLSRFEAQAVAGLREMINLNLKEEERTRASERSVQLARRLQRAERRSAWPDRDFEREVHFFCHVDERSLPVACSDSSFPRAFRPSLFPSRASEQAEPVVARRLANRAHVRAHHDS